MHRPLRIGRDWLAIAATAFLAANLLHGADHIRQHLAGVDTEVFVGGAMLTAAAVVVAIVALRRSPRASLLATVVGFAAAVLVAASHIAPHWSALSDSYIDDIHPDALAWAVMLLEVAAGFLLGVAGVHELRARARGANDGGAFRMLHPRHRALGMRTKAAAAGRTAPKPEGLSNPPPRETTVCMEVHE